MLVRSGHVRTKVQCVRTMSLVVCPTVSSIHIVLERGQFDFEEAQDVEDGALLLFQSVLWT